MISGKRADVLIEGDFAALEMKMASAFTSRSKSQFFGLQYGAHTYKPLQEPTMNSQNRKDLVRRSGVTSTILNLLRRAPGLDLLDFNEGHNRVHRVVPVHDNGNLVGKAVEDGFELERLDTDGGMVFRKLVGIFYPVRSQFGRG